MVVTPELRFARIALREHAVLFAPLKKTSLGQEAVIFRLLKGITFWTLRSWLKKKDEEEG
jgi:hypothetical protein